MEYFLRLDMSVEETSVYVVDDTGRIVRELKVASKPEALLRVLTKPIYRFKRIGVEVGSLSPRLFSALAEDTSPPETAHTADPPQTAAVEGHRDR
jgi:transposase